MLINISNCHQEIRDDSGSKTEKSNGFPQLSSVLSSQLPQITRKTFPKIIKLIFQTFGS